MMLQAVAIVLVAAVKFMILKWWRHERPEEASRVRESVQRSVEPNAVVQQNTRASSCRLSLYCFLSFPNPKYCLDISLLNTSYGISKQYRRTGIYLWRVSFLKLSRAGIKHRSIFCFLSRKKCAQMPLSITDMGLVNHSAHLVFYGPGSCGVRLNFWWTFRYS